MLRPSCALKAEGQWSAVWAPRPSLGLHSQSPHNGTCYQLSRPYFGGLGLSLNFIHSAPTPQLEAEVAFPPTLSKSHLQTWNKTLPWQLDLEACLPASQGHHAEQPWVLDS